VTLYVYTPPAVITPTDITNAGKTAYYVKSGGSDGLSGTSPANAWATIAKVNGFTFAAGDGVFFEGGTTFGTTVLAPPQNGASAGVPFVFGSYGTGRATISLGCLVPAARTNVTIDNLILKNVLGASTGTAKDMIVTQNCLLGGFATEYGHECSNAADTNWQFKGCEVYDTRDSGMINWGDSLLVEGCQIHHTGTQFATYNFGLHGIYSKSPNAIVRFCEIYDVMDPDGQCVTTRFRNILIEGNYFHDAFEGVGFYNDDATAPGAGRTSTIRYNRMRNVQNGILIDANGNTVAGMPENWMIYNNSIECTPFSGAGSSYSTPLRYYNNSVLGGATKGTLLRVHNNIFSALAAASNLALIDYIVSPALATFTESNNVQYSPLGFFSNFNATGCSSLAAWVTASGQGSSDLTSDPLMDSSAVTTTPSPVINAGTLSISGVTFSVGSDGAPLHYMGSAPDISATEFVPAASTPARMRRS
jgi:hypothetical protein